MKLAISRWHMTKWHYNSSIRFAVHCTSERPCVYIETSREFRYSNLICIKSSPTFFSISLIQLFEFVCLVIPVRLPYFTIIKHTFQRYFRHSSCFPHFSFIIYLYVCISMVAILWNSDNSSVLQSIILDLWVQQTVVSKHN